MTLNEHFIEIDGVKYRYLSGGSSIGAPVLFLHGWGSKADRYCEAFKYVPENSANFVIPDLPGFGASPLPTTVWGTNEYTDWVEKLALKLGWTKFILAGHSFGGKISLSFASVHSEMLSGLILYASAGVTKRRPVKLSLLKLIATGGKKIMQLPILRNFYGFAEKIFYRAIGSTDYLNTGERKEIFKKVIAEDFTPILDKISVPTKILWGSVDAQTPLQDAELLNEKIRGSELRVVNNATHLLHTQSPQLFASEFSALLAKLIAGK